MAPASALIPNTQLCHEQEGWETLRGAAAGGYVIIKVLWKDPTKMYHREGVRFAALTTPSPSIHGDSDLATDPCSICLFIH